MAKRKFFARMWAAIKKFFTGLSPKLQKFTEATARVLEGVKAAVNSPEADLLSIILSEAIKGEKDDFIIAKIKDTVNEWVPKLLWEVEFLEQLKSEEDVNQKIRMVLDKIGAYSDNQRFMAFSGFAALFIEKLSDGEIDRSDGLVLMKYYYDNILKK